MSETGLTLLSFRLDGRWLGLDVTSVLEIQAVDKLSRVLGAPAYLKGLVNVRGEILTVLDLRPVLELPLQHPEQSFLILVRHQQQSFGLEVDEVGEVLELGPDEIEALPMTVGAGLAAIGTGYWNGLTGGLALIDAARLVPPEFQNALRRVGLLQEA